MSWLILVVTVFEAIWSAVCPWVWRGIEDVSWVPVNESVDLIGDSAVVNSTSGVCCCGVGPVLASEGSVELAVVDAWVWC